MWFREALTAARTFRRVLRAGGPPLGTRSAQDYQRHQPAPSPTPALGDCLLWGVSRWGQGTWGPERYSPRPCHWRGRWGRGTWGFFFWGRPRARVR